jgi:hypothetical protein
MQLTSDVSLLAAGVFVLVLILLVRWSTARAITRDLTTIDRVVQRQPELEVTRNDDVEQQMIADALCFNCMYFELERAQDALRRNAGFMKMTTILSPHEQGKTAKYREDPCPDCAPDSNEPCVTCCGQRRIAVHIGYEYKNSFPIEAKWEDMGWCTNERLDQGRPYNENIIYGGNANCNGKLFELRRKKPKLRVA